MTNTNRRTQSNQSKAIPVLTRLLLAGSVMLAGCGEPTPEAVSEATASAAQRTTEPITSSAPIADATSPPSTEGSAGPTSPTSTEAGADSTQGDASTVAPETGIDVSGRLEQPALSEEGGVTGPLAYWMSYGSDFMCCDEAAVAGTLQHISDCLYVHSTDQLTVTYRLVWPYGTVWDNETETATLADGIAVTVGERMALSGGYYQPDELSKFTTAPEVNDYVTGCEDATTTAVAVIQKP